MIFALRHPSVLLGLVLGFLVGMTVRALVQQRVALGGRRLRSVGGVSIAGPRWSWATVLDPYGTVAAVLSGVGWNRRPDAIRRRAGTDVLMLVAALVVHGALAAAALFAFTKAPSGGPADIFRYGPVSDVLLGRIGGGPALAEIALGFAAVNIACGLLALLPIPPLELGVVLWGRLPRSPGARRLAYHLLEEQWGVAIVLVLLLLPIAGQLPVLLSLIDTVTTAIFGG